MSTVLRPVGPLGPRVYWLRRAVLIGFVLLLILIIAVSCGGGGGSNNGNPGAGNHPKTHPTTTTTPSNPPITACDPSALKLTLSTDTQTYTSGQAPKLIGVFTNSGTTACKLSMAASGEIWTIKSGSALIWTNKGCTSSQSVKQPTIQPGATKMTHIFWNGHLIAKGCSEGTVAQPGTYTLHATLDGVPGSVAVFHISA